jgi:hypothetical protein
MSLLRIEKKDSKGILASVCNRDDSGPALTVHGSMDDKLGWGFGLVVRAECRQAIWICLDVHVYPQRREHSWDEYVRYKCLFILMRAGGYWDVRFVTVMISGAALTAHGSMDRKTQNANVNFKLQWPDTSSKLPPGKLYSRNIFVLLCWWASNLAGRRNGLNLVTEWHTAVLFPQAAKWSLVNSNKSVEQVYNHPGYESVILCF